MCQTGDAQDSAVIRKKSNNLNESYGGNNGTCSICRDLLADTQRFFDMLQNVCKSSAPDWLTVDEVASELRISKTIVYRLIHHGELEAINIVETNGKIVQRGHYRIRRSSLNQYLESKKVRPFLNESARKSRSRRFPKVKNHLGL